LKYTVDYMDTFFALVMMFISQFFGIDSGGVQTAIDQTFPVHELAQVLSVIDGDTIRVRLNGVEETVRYIGIDTPEPYRDGEPACYSGDASRRNAELVADREVRLVTDVENRDRYERLLRYVYVDDIFVNEKLLEQGYAITLTIRPNTQYKSKFAVAEAAARREGVGLWSACSGQITVQPEVGTADTTVIDTAQLTEGQRRLLNFLGIDTTVFTVTAEMVICANDAVGISRLAEITTGGLPSIAEGIKLIGCYQL
jgi:endonuclease YncB( thermonuclease family)